MEVCATSDQPSKTKNYVFCFLNSSPSMIGQTNREPCPNLTPLFEPVLLCWPGQEAKTNKVMFQNCLSATVFSKGLHIAVSAY